jgi:hypothetical protein
MAMSWEFKKVLYRIMIVAGQVALRCAWEPMSTGCDWQNGMSAGDATVRMRLEIGRREIPSAKGNHRRTMEG